MMVVDMEFDETDEAKVKLMEQQMTEATQIALEHIPAYAPFRGLPDRVNMRMMREFSRIADTNAVSRPEMRAMLQNTLPGYLAGMQNRVLIHPNLGPVRIVVLIHVAMVIGLPGLMGMDRLWDAIRADRWDEGARILLKSHWPGSAMCDEERDRIIDIADMFRTGSAPRTWTT